MADSPALLSAHGVRLSYGTQVLLEDVSLAVAPGEKVGLVGRNGCGKTSLLKILSGENPPDDGTLSRRRGLRTGYLPQEFELESSLSVLENIQAGAADVMEWIRRFEAGEASPAELAALQEKIEHSDGWNLDSRIRAIANALFAPPLDAPVGPLSGGENDVWRSAGLSLPNRTSSCSMNPPTTSIPSPSAGWKGS